MLLLLVLGMLKVLVVLVVLEELVVLIGGVFEKGIIFFLNFHGPQSPGLPSLWGLWL